MVVFSEGHKAETCRKGRIEVICGSMFSGKTEELIRRLKRATFARQRVEIFKPSIDVRYSEEKVVSHDNNSIPSTPVDSSASILLFTSEIDVVGIDEAQFFDEGLTEVCNELANNGIRVIVAGLDMDYKGIPFGPIPSLCAIADARYGPCFPPPTTSFWPYSPYLLSSSTSFLSCSITNRLPTDGSHFFLKSIRGWRFVSPRTSRPA